MYAVIHIMHKVNFCVDIEPSLAQFSGDSLLALDDISQSIRSSINDLEINKYFDAPSARLSSVLPHQERLDITNFGPYYDQNTKQTRPSSEHSLAIVPNDLYVPGLNYLFGLTSPEQRVSIVSVNRIIASTRDAKLASGAIRLVARHEVGHQFGLKSIFDEHTGSDPLYDGHCDQSICTMRQVMSPSELFNLVEKQEGKDVFCADCHEELAIEALKRVMLINEY